MQRIEISHSAKLIQLSNTSAFASSANNVLLKSQIIDNVTSSASGELNLPVSIAVQTLPVPTTMLLLTSATTFFLRYTTADAVVSPMIQTKSFLYDNALNQIITIEIWNGSLSYAAPATFTVQASSIVAVISYISAS